MRGGIPQTIQVKKIAFFGSKTRFSFLFGREKFIIPLFEGTGGKIVFAIVPFDFAEAEQQIKEYTERSAADFAAAGGIQFAYVSAFRGVVVMNAGLFQKHRFRPVALHIAESDFIFKEKRGQKIFDR